MTAAPWRRFERSMQIEADHHRRLGEGRLRAYSGPLPPTADEPTALRALVGQLTGPGTTPTAAVDRLAGALHTSDRILLAWSHEAPIGLVTARWVRTRDLEGWYLTLTWVGSGSTRRGLLATMVRDLVAERPCSFIATTTISPAVHRVIRGVAPNRPVFPSGTTTEPEHVVSAGRSVLGAVFGPRVADALTDEMVRPRWVVGPTPPPDTSAMTPPFDRLAAGDGLFVIADLDGRIAPARQESDRKRPLTVAVTGTNGKTSVVEYGRQLSQASGRSALSLGSLGLVSDRRRIRRPRVSQGPGGLAATAHDLRQQGTEVLWLEAFSRALARGLLEGVEVDVGVLTQIDLDHLGLHRSPARYRAAKLRLFEQTVVPGGTVVVDPSASGARPVLEVARSRRLDLVRLGRGGDVELQDVALVAGQARATLVVHGTGHDIVLPTAAPYQWENILGAVGATVALGAEAARVAEAVSGLEPPPGRLQRVENPSGIEILIDAAHNGSALEATLGHLRSTTKGRLLALVASVGTADRNRWESIGETAAVLADEVVVADESPHRTDPAVIRAGILSGCPDGTEVPDRAEAVAAILDRARPGDTVVLAGRADEDFLVTRAGRESYPTDAELVADWLSAATPGA